MILSFLSILLTELLWETAAAEPVTPRNRPKFMDVFSQHQKWEGYYIYNETHNGCSLYINSEHYSKGNAVLATLKDWHGAIVEMEGEQDGSDPLSVIFTVHVMFNNVGRFPKNFTFHSTLYQKNDKWYISSRITVPVDSLFGELVLYQGDGVIGPWSDGKPEAWRYFLIIGIPLIVGVTGVIVMVRLVYWAVKKGYIRQVPKSYDSFHNPVSFDNERQDVHI